MRHVWVRLILALGLVMMVVTPVLALDARSGLVLRVPAGEVLNDDLVLTGETATIDGTVNGDVFAAVNTLFITGTINGNLYAAASAVELDGTVTGTVVSFGERIVVNGQIGRNLVAAGERVLLGTDSLVGQNFLGAGDYLEHLGMVQRGATLAGSRIHIAGDVGAEVRAGVDRLEIGPNSRIGGTVTYWSDRQAQVASEAQFASITRKDPKNWRFPGTRWTTGPVVILVKFAGFVLVGLVLLALLPGLRQTFPQRIMAKPWQAPLAGFLSLLVVPVGSILLCLTIIGIPLGIFALLSLPLVVYASQILMSWSVGQLLASQSESFKGLHWTALFLIGAIITTAVIRLPYIGHVAAWALVFYGLGGIFFSIMHREKTL